MTITTQTCSCCGSETSDYYTIKLPWQSRDKPRRKVIRCKKCHETAEWRESRDMFRPLAGVFGSWRVGRNLEDDR